MGVSGKRSSTPDLGLMGPAITTSEITRELVKMEVKTGRELVMPNYTPEGWWECDVASISDAGFLTEYEVKVSRGDFMRDFKKEKYIGGASMEKHDRLMLDNPFIKEYWFVCPAMMIQEKEVPSYAGLIYASREQNDWAIGRVVLNVVRQAKRFGNVKSVSAKEIERMRRNAHFRLLNAITEGRLK